MDDSRRDFLKVAGLAALGVTTAPAAKAVAADKYKPAPKALTASRWVMIVDVKKCLAKVEKDGCTDCLKACNLAHNIPEIEGPKEEIKWIWKEEYHNTFPDQAYEHVAEAYEGKPFVVLCNHCEQPPCVRVCPTKATFKREQDGIVSMDMHRCIGCRFCMAACPYGSRSFNFRDPVKYLPDPPPNPDYPTRTLGVVEKCQFCVERLAEGLPPACVEACKADALIFGDLNDPGSEVRRILRSRYTIRRKPSLGTNPGIYYLV